MSVFTSTELLDEIRTRGAIPESNNAFTAARLLRLINSEIAMDVVPRILNARENYFEYNIDTTVNASGEYPIPSRALMSSISDVSLINGDNRLDLALYQEDELDRYDVSPVDGVPGFYVKRHSIYLLPRDGSGYPTLRMVIPMRPNRVVEVADAAQITAISSNTISFASGTMPTSWTTSSTIDYIQQNPHFDWLAIDQAITTVNTDQLVMTSTPPSTLAVGDWVALAGESPIPQIPEAFHYYLAQLIANVYMRSQGDTEGLKSGMDEVLKMQDGLAKAIEPRVHKAGQKIINSSGLLRTSST